MRAIALAGARGSGKSTVAHQLALNTGALHIRVSAWLRSVAGEQGRAVSAAALRAVGEDAARNPTQLVDDVLAYAGWDGRQDIIFDAIRHVEVLNALAERLGVTPCLIFLDLEVQERETRLLSRGDLSAVRAGDGHSTESQLESIRELSDHIIDAGGTVHSIVSEVLIGCAISARTSSRG